MFLNLFMLAATMASPLLSKPNLALDCRIVGLSVGQPTMPDGEQPTFETVRNGVRIEFDVTWPIVRRAK
jgi:hypothetical protein